MGTVMAHFAEIVDTKVVRVLVTDNNDPNGDEGLQWLQDTFGGTWVQTSYNSKIRGKFAGVGDTYDLKADRFIVASPFPSWKLDKNLDWVAPVSMPKDGKRYNWDETQINWVENVELP
jgi:hypothetical protein